MNVSEHRTGNISVILLCIIGCAFILVYSYTTSPLYRYCFGIDSIQFLTFGRDWAQGHIPYRDMFDHKGPIIFFVNMLGYKMTGDPTGVMLVQLVFMCFTVAALYKTGSLYINNGILLFVCTLITQILMETNYISGDTVEEFCLPFLCWSFYGMLKFYRDKPSDHSLKWAFFYGLTLGVCFLSRITNYIPLCALLAGITVKLLIDKNYKNLVRCIGYYLAGAFMMFIPFAVYFTTKGCFGDFLYGTFIHNVKYTMSVRDIDFIMAYINGFALKDKLFGYFVSYIILFAAVINIIKKEYYTAAVFVISCVLEMAFFLSGSMFMQYPLVCISQVPLAIGEGIALFGSLKKKGLHKYIYAGTMILMTFMTLGYIKRLASVMTVQPFRYRSFYDVSVRDAYPWASLIEDNVPVSDRDSFVTYGGEDLKSVYLMTDTVSPYKYGMIQEWYAHFSKEVAEEISDEFRNGDVKWILVGDNDYWKFGESTDCIQDTLDERYSLYAYQGDYQLYRINTYQE